MSRFESSAKKNLEKINKNLYISKSDPLYYEKILRYVDPHSAEAHYNLAQKHEEAGAFNKAFTHYQEAAQLHSPYSNKAKDAIKTLESRIHLENNGSSQTLTQKHPIPMYLKSLIAFLFFLLLLLLALLFLKNSSDLPLANSKNIDTPYVIYLPIDMPTSEMEKTLQDQAIAISRDKPTQNILLYGVLTENSQLKKEVLPLKNEQLKANAFALAKYYPSFDQSAKIHFLKNNDQLEESSSYALTFIGTNIVRTALQTYIKDYGYSPKTLDKLVGEYPNNYLSFIPNEAQTASNQISTTYTGEGGWVYNQNARSIASMFYPNIPANTNNNPSSIPFHPVEIFVEKDTYSLVVKSTPYIISKKQVGLGKNHSTPEGFFEVQNRVINPIGVNPKAFGYAGLGMGDIAIHGTFNEDSIGQQQSLGCIRLANEDIVDIFDFVPKGTIVTIEETLPSVAENILVNNTNQLIPTIKPKVLQTSDTIFHWAG